MTAPGVDAPREAVPEPAEVRRSLALVLCLLTVFGPISMDLYLPVLPALTRDLGAATSTAQLTVTACLMGLGGGQLVAGPLSDRYGRRRPLLIGVTAYVVATVLCGLSPTVQVLIGARFEQGLTGSVGIVIAQAAGRDVYSGRRLVRFYSRLTVLGGLAAIIGPVIGGQLAAVTSWRGVFVFLAVVGVAVFAAASTVFGETLPVAQRRTGEMADTGHDFRRLVTDPAFRGAVLVSGLVSAALFAYLSGATFVLQGIYGLSPQQYSLAFGLNSLGFVAAGFTAGRLSEHWSQAATLVLGLVVCLVGATGLLAAGLFRLPLAAVIVSLVVMVSGVAVTSPPSTALAMADHPDIAGTAAALMGTTRYVFGGVAAPLVGLAGPDTAVPLGVVTVTATTAALIAGTALARRHRLPARATTDAASPAPSTL